MGNIKSEQGHINRTDNFRYEDKAVIQSEALLTAKDRSLKTHKTITVLQHNENEEYIINSHGIELSGYFKIAQYKRGVLTFLK